jgi:hypothetical protein
MRIAQEHISSTRIVAAIFDVDATGPVSSENILTLSIKICDREDDVSPSLLSSEDHQRAS